jgi:uncharacterized membrane protein
MSFLQDEFRRDEYALYMIKIYSAYFMGIFYVVAGLNHLIKTKWYEKMIPRFIPQPRLMVYLSGVAEMALGALLLVPSYRSLAAWGIIALLIAVFPANIYMYQQGSKKFGVPDKFLLLRLPMQGLLILWAYWYTR